MLFFHKYKYWYILYIYNMINIRLRQYIIVDLNHYIIMYILKYILVYRIQLYYVRNATCFHDIYTIAGQNYSQLPKLFTSSVRALWHTYPHITGYFMTNTVNSGGDKLLYRGNALFYEKTPMAYVNHASRTLTCCCI